MSRAPLSYWTAALQSAVAIIFLCGYFGMMAILFLGWATIPANLLELAKTLAIALTNAMGLLFAFLYLRSRVDGPPDPTTTSTTSTVQTVTTPTPSPETTPHEITTPPPVPPPVTPAAHGLPVPGAQHPAKL